MAAESATSPVLSAARELARVAYRDAETRGDRAAATRALSLILRINALLDPEEDHELEDRAHAAEMVASLGASESYAESPEASDGPEEEDGPEGQWVHGYGWMGI
jgi:hypothetical protein